MEAMQGAAGIWPVAAPCPGAKGGTDPNVGSARRDGAQSARPARPAAYYTHVRPAGKPRSG